MDSQRNLISSNEFKKGIGNHGKKKLSNIKRSVFIVKIQTIIPPIVKIESIAEQKKILMKKKIIVQLHW